MGAGELRHRATIESAVVTADEHGQDETTWTIFARRLPVKVFEQGSREVFLAQQIKADITHLVKARWMAGIVGKMRLIWHDGTTDRTLSIEGGAINPDGKRVWMHLTCKEPV